MSKLGILALDLATSTGWALRGRDGSVTSGVQLFDVRRGESPGMRFLRCRRWLAEMLGDLRIGDNAASWDVEEHRSTIRLVRQVDVVAYEKAHHRGGHATACLVGLATVVQEEAARLGIELAPVATGTLKKHATGSGGASKEQMVRAAIKRWPHRRDGILEENQALGEDEADALCVLAWALDELEGRPCADGAADEAERRKRGAHSREHRPEDTARRAGDAGGRFA